MRFLSFSLSFPFSLVTRHSSVAERPCLTAFDGRSKKERENLIFHLAFFYGLPDPLTQGPTEIRADWPKSKDPHFFVQREPLVKNKEGRSSKKGGFGSPRMMIRFDRWNESLKKVFVQKPERFGLEMSGNRCIADVDFDGRKRIKRDETLFVTRTNICFDLLMTLYL